MCRCSLPPHQASSVIVSGLLGAGEKGPLVASGVKRCGARACVSRLPSYFFPEAGPPCPSEISQGPVAFQEVVGRVRPGPAFLHPWGGGERKAKGGRSALGSPGGRAQAGGEGEGEQGPLGRVGSLTGSRGRPGQRQQGQQQQRRPSEGSGSGHAGRAAASSARPASRAAAAGPGQESWRHSAAEA